MSNWTVPVSSSSPSTPGSKQHNANSHANGFGSPASNPSTTPAGPPPSSANSFTPAGPPPSSVLKTSQDHFGQLLFPPKSNIGLHMGSRRDPNSPSFKTIHPNKKTRDLGGSRRIQKSSIIPRVKPPRNHAFNSSPSPSVDNDDDESIESEESDEQDVGDSEERDFSDDFEYGSEDIEVDAENKSREPTSKKYAPVNGLVTDEVAFGSSPYTHSIRDGTQRGIKRSHVGRAISPRSTNRGGKPRQPKQDSAIPSIAKDLASQLGVARLDDPDHLIIGTEQLVSQIYNLKHNAEGGEGDLEIALSKISEDLKTLWKGCCDEVRDESLEGEDYTVGIGPDENAPPFKRAVFLATLLLQLHHPPPAKGQQALAAPRKSRASGFSPARPSYSPQNPTALPKVLVSWLNDHHYPYRVATLNLMTHEPNPTASFNFWDMMFTSALRGQIRGVIQLLKSSDFKDACTAREDGLGQSGYQGSQLENIKKVINIAIQLLELCPALQDGDWNVSGSEWQTFRKRIEQALNDLAIFAEGHDRDMDPTESTFEAPNFGIRSATKTLSQTSRRIESRVPWTIYRSLKTLYGIFLGGTTEIISVAQDWIEAAIGLTIWWDGDDDDDDFAVGNLAMTRRSLRRSQSRNTRFVDLNATAAYLRRLAFAFERVTNDSDGNMFQISPIDAAEVGLASLFEGNVESVLAILQGWSLPIASAVVEIACLGGWYDSSAGGAMRGGFNESDLMVLSYDQEEQASKKNSLLAEYAEALYARNIIEEPLESLSKEGWELSIEVLSRVDDASLVNKKVSKLLSRIPLLSDERVDKILDICGELQMEREAHSIAEKYADSVAENSDRYGTAIIYYARAHCSRKVKDVLDLLISFSLVQSLAFPPLSSLDQNLHALIFFPRASLDQLGELDREAAELLHLYLTGYATLRKFYDLRDEELNLENGQKPRLRPITREKAAAGALLAVINSAADNIHGGLYDEERGSVVQVDGLLALLGEARYFVDQPQGILSLSQSFALLRAIEDLQTVTPRVYAVCEDFFRSTLAAAHGFQQTPSPGDLLKKNVSNMTSSSGFSLVSTSMLEFESSVGGAGSGSGVIVKRPSDGGKGDGVKRCWDWRNGMARDMTGDDLLGILRLGLARDISRAWVDGDAQVFRSM